MTLVSKVKVEIVHSQLKKNRITKKLLTFRRHENLSTLKKIFTEAARRHLIDGNVCIDLQV